MPDANGIKVKMLVTKWYLWKCPKRFCRKRIQSTVEKFTLSQAAAHLKKHERDLVKAKQLEEQKRALASVTR